MDVALASLADKAAVAFASCVNLAIAEAAHSRHGTQSQAFFFTGHEAVVVGPSHTHASVGHGHVTAQYQPRSYTTDPAHRKCTAPSKTDSGSAGIERLGWNEISCKEGTDKMLV